ncbi:MAG: FAD-dependent oxidoreductase [Alphaproteobacteria bacterium]|nr:FAD-dependent oxidoreductase [Alphaproteobacteria bacterium]
MSGKHVVVIGAGIVGACTAIYLQRDGYRVTLIDKGAPGEGASLGNAGCLNASSVVPVSMPGTLSQVPRWLFDPMGPLTIRWGYLPAIAPWLWRFVRAGTPERVAQIAAALRPMTGPTVGMHRELARAAGVEHMIHHVGHVHVYRSDEAFAKDGAAMALRQSQGTRIDELGADELRQLEPELDRGYVRARLITENGHCGDPLKLTAAYVDHARRQGATVRRARATGFRFEGSHATAVFTDQGDIAGDMFVVAGGAWSRELAAALGDDVPLDTERGYHVVIRDPEAGPRTPTSAFEGKFVATPMDMGLRAAGTVEFGGLEATPNWQRADNLVKQLQAMYPRLARNLPEERISRWMGFRPSMPDSLPVVGRASRIANAYYGFGHGHVGLISAPMTGRLLGDLIVGRKPTIDPSPYAVTRFA